MKKIIQSILIIVVFAFSSQLGAQWQKIGDFIAINVSANGDFVIVGDSGSDIYLSTDNGTSWNSVGLNATGKCSFEFKGTDIYAGTENGLFLSTNSGVSWTEIEIDSVFYFHYITAIGISGENIFAATGSGVYRSTNDGMSWTNTGLTGGVEAFAFSGDNIFAGTSNSNIFLSNDNGVNWIAVNSGLPQYFHVYALAFSGNNLFTGMGYGIYVTTNNGTSWDSVSTSFIMVTALAVSDGNLFAGTWGMGIHLTQNNGNSWNQVGWPTWSVRNISVNDTYLFVALYDGVYRALLNDVTPVEEFEAIPTLEMVSQNYPNPFNPVTTISYQIPQTEFVTLKVYDILGREVATLVNEEKPAGSYEVQFNSHSGEGRNLTSGIYFYQLSTGNYTETKKMILLK